MTKNTRTRILLVAVASLLLVTMAVGGTMAWLQDSSDVVTNTFKGSELAIDMWEHPIEEDGKTLDADGEITKTVDSYKMVPGVTLQKDPYAVVEKGSEPCYVFVVVEKSDNFDDFIETVNYNTDDWKLVDGYKNVWAYQTKVEALEQEVATSSILDAENAIVVKTDLSTDDLDITANFPTLSFTAYAIQSEYLTDGYTIENNAAAIWELTGITNGVEKN